MVSFLYSNLMRPRPFLSDAARTDITRSNYQIFTLGDDIIAFSIRLGDLCFPRKSIRKYREKGGGISGQ